MVERNLNKWTEGEWKTAPNDLHFKSLTYVVGPSGELICDAFGQEMGEEERKANAKLIAASPKLYSALKEIVNAADGDGWRQIDAGLESASSALSLAEFDDQ